jgi:DinB superfamily
VKFAFAAALLFSCLTCAIAQTSSSPSSTPAAQAGSTKDPVTASLRLLMPRSRNNILGAINAMPADKFSYKPTPDQITFAHLAVHIVNSNRLLCSKAADVEAPKVDELKETDSKEKMVAAATASFDFCNDALGKMDDSKLGDSVDIFGGKQLPRAVAALALASGWADHYSAAAQYLRLNGIVPPSAQPKK